MVQNNRAGEELQSYSRRAERGFLATVVVAVLLLLATLGLFGAHELALSMAMSAT